MGAGCGASWSGAGDGDLMFDWFRRMTGQADFPTRSRQYRTTDPEFITLASLSQYTAGSYSLASSIGAIYGAIKLIADQLAPLTRTVRRGNEEVDHPLNDLLAQPYSQWDCWRAWNFVIWQLATNGNAFFITRRMRGNGAPVDLIPAIEGGAKYDANGRILYELSPVNVGAIFSGQLMPLSSTQVVAFHWHNFDGLTSPSPIQYAANAALGLNVGAYQHLNRMLSRSKNSGPVIQYRDDGTGNRPAPKQIADTLGALANAYNETVSAGKMPVLPPGLSGGFVPGLQPADLAIIELLRWTVEDICRVYSISPARMAQQSGGGAGVRTQKLTDQLTDLERTAVAPVAQLFDSALTKSLLTPAERMAGLRIVTDTWSIGLGSLADRAAIADQLVAKAPIWTPNEARQKLFGMGPLDGGDELMQPKGAPGDTLPGGNDPDDPPPDDDDDA